MKKLNELDYSNLPGVKKSLKLLIKALLVKFYIKPKTKLQKSFSVESMKRKIFYTIAKYYQLPTDEPIITENGLKGLHLIASYTDRDKGFLPGLINSCEAFEKIILYHDKSGNNFKYNESLRFQLLIAAAKREGADWVLIGSPKTRFSSNFKKQVEPYVKKYSGTATVLALKERFLWEDFEHHAHTKRSGPDPEIRKFFSVTDTMVFDNKPIHAAQHPVNYTNIVYVDACRYYLGRFNLKIMKQKADFYHKKDGKDYSYMYDMSNPIPHEEKILGVGDYEARELMGK